MNVLYEHHHEPVIALLPQVDMYTIAEMSVIIYDSVRNDFAVNVSWFEECIRREWGVVKDINPDDHKIKLVRDDGIWWIPIGKLLQVDRI